MLASPTVATCHQRRRVASETAVSTPGPEAVALSRPNTVMIDAVAIGQRRRYHTRM